MLKSINLPNQSINMLAYETQAQTQGLRFIYGVDEAGRGPLAGPVVAAAVYLSTFEFENPINDSKQMTQKARENAFHEILAKAHVGIGVISETAIDQINILNASHLAMEWAVVHLTRRMPVAHIADDFVAQTMLLIDGNRFSSHLPYRYTTIIEGDAKSLSIACASIIAKVYRDRIMHHYDRLFPQYGFAKHKGYATQQHREALKEHGPSRIHRRSFQWS